MGGLITQTYWMTLSLSDYYNEYKQKELKE